MAEFDLAEVVGSPSAKRTMKVHWCIRLVLSAGFVAFGYLAVPVFERSGWTTESFAAAGTLIIAAGLLAWIFVMTGPGATYLSVEDGGLTFRYHSGRLLRLRWRDHRFVLNIFEAVTPSSGESVRYIQFGSGLWPVTNFLTTEALAGVITEATKHGLVVVSRKLQDGAVTWYRIVHPPSGAEGARRTG